VNSLSWGWILGFMEKYNLSERATSTHIPQIIPIEIQNQLVESWGFIHCALKHLLVLPSRLGNCDEAPIYFGYGSKKQ